MFPISNQMIYLPQEKCASKACGNLGEVVSKIEFPFLQNWHLFSLYSLNIYLMNNDTWQGDMLPLLKRLLGHL